MQVTKFAITCPKWALPCEEIPLHVKINNDLVSKLKHVEIDLPSCFQLVDTINIAKHSSSGRIIVSEIEKSQHSDYAYFGIVIATKKPFDDLKREIPIPVTFQHCDGTAETGHAHARIFRPLLEMEEIPASITLTEKSNGICLPLRVKFIGFGEITLRTECWISGKIVSTGTSVLDEILRRMISGKTADDDLKSQVTVNSNYIEEMIAQLKNEFRSDASIQRLLHEGRLDKEHIGMLYNLSKEEKQQTVGLLHKTMDCT